MLHCFFSFSLFPFKFSQNYIYTNLELFTATIYKWYLIKSLYILLSIYIYLEFNILHKIFWDKSLSNSHILKFLKHKMLLPLYRYLVLAAESRILLLHLNILCSTHFLFKIVFHLLNCFPYSTAFLSCKDMRIPWYKSYRTMRQNINLDLTLENDMQVS